MRKITLFFFFSQVPVIIGPNSLVCLLYDFNFGRERSSTRPVNPRGKGNPLIEFIPDHVPLTRPSYSPNATRLICVYFPSLLTKIYFFYFFTYSCIFFVLVFDIYDSMLKSRSGFFGFEWILDFDVE